MLALSQTTGYAIRALACLHHCGEGRMLAKDVARCTGIPLPYLLKIFHLLGRSGLIAARRGVRGGFGLRNPLHKISFYDVARVIEGDQFIPECFLGLGGSTSCDTSCRSHRLWKSERRRVIRFLQSLTLADAPAPSGGSNCAGSCACWRAGHVKRKPLVASRPRQRSWS